MQPSLIRSTAESSLTLLDARGRGSPEALLLAWVAWEGLKVRVLVVGLAMHGWKVQDIYDAVSTERVHTVEHVRGVFRTLFGAFPENTKGVSKTWQHIEQFREVRNRYVHGARGAAPLRLEAGTHLITEHVLDTAWLHGMPFALEGQRTTLGDPYRRLSSSRTGGRSLSSLRNLLRDARPRR